MSAALAALGSPVVVAGSKSVPTSGTMYREALVRALVASPGAVGTVSPYCDSLGHNIEDKWLVVRLVAQCACARIDKGDRAVRRGAVAFVHMASHVVARPHALLQLVEQVEVASTITR
eukprot:5743346-Prymnesium_polylepis.1